MACPLITKQPSLPTYAEAHLHAQNRCEIVILQKIEGHPTAMTNVVVTDDVMQVVQSPICRFPIIVELVSPDLKGLL